MKSSKPLIAVLSLLLVAGVLLGCSTLGEGFLFPEGEQLLVRFLFAVNGNGGSIAAFRVNPDTGALTAISGSPFEGLSSEGQARLTATLDGRFVYTTNGSSQIAGFSVNQDTGALTPVPGSPFEVGDDIRGGIMAAPNSRFLFASDEDFEVLFVFVIGANGALTQAPGSPYEAGPRPWGIAVDPLSRFVFLTDRSDDTIRAYAINSDTGALTEAPGSPFVSGEGGGLRYPVVDRSGRFLYATHANNGEVYAFTINQTNGALTAAGEFEAGCGPVGIAAHPSFDLIAVANWCFDEGSNNPTTVSVYSINTSTGALTNVPGSPFEFDVAIHHLVFDPSGRYIYLAAPFADENGQILGFTVNAQGQVVQVTGSPFTTGLQNPVWLAATR